jgi:DNA-binding MarR family transcriptional regulator
MAIHFASTEGIIAFHGRYIPVVTDHVGRIQEQWRRERPDLDVFPQGVYGRLHRLADRLRDELEVEFRRFGLGEGEFDVLAALRRAGAPYELAPGELARHTMVTTGAATKRIDRLEAAGLVSRRVSDEDHRGRVIGLTEAGRRVIDDAFTAHIANEHRLLDPLTDKDRMDLERVLTKWLAAFEE